MCEDSAGASCREELSEPLEGCACKEPLCLPCPRVLLRITDIPVYILQSWQGVTVPGGLILPDVHFYLVTLGFSNSL